VTIVARNFQFEPATLDVTAGQKITFQLENRDQVDHNLVSAEGGFQEVVVAGGQTTAVEWTPPSRVGALKFVCTFHRGMEMTVNVK
jgi:plastocyanin